MILRQTGERSAEGERSLRFEVDPSFEAHTLEVARGFRAEGREDLAASSEFLLELLRYECEKLQP